MGYKLSAISYKLIFMEVITTHTNADFDSLASMLAAKKLYPGAVLVFPGSQERSLREFFIHSTLYAFEVERVKNIDLQEVEKLILVDTRQISRIGKFSEILSKPGLEIHIYDHHPPSSDDIHGSFEVISEVGATVTLLSELLIKKGIEITSDEATVMLLGIYEDTGNLTFSSAREEDFHAAGYLVRKGANLNILSNVITKELTSEQVFLLNDLIQSATRYDVHGIDVVIAQASVDRYVGDIAILVHKLKDMENLDVLFVLVQMEGRIYLIGRSRIEEVKVSEIAAEFGGGGHPTAASATIKGMTIIEAHGHLLRILRETVRPKKLAKDLMVYPVKTIEPDRTLEEAGEVLTRYHLDMLPVFQKGKVIGLLSKEVVERAIHHGLKDALVREYMTTEFSTISPETPFSRIQELVIGQNQNLLPVIEGERLAGIITTGDVMQVFQEEMMKSVKESQPLHARKKMISKLMKERFPDRIQNLLVEFGKVGDALGYSVFAVGGFVRDLLMRVENFDVDIVVEGDGIRLAEEFEKRFPCRIRTHRKFGTAIILFSDGLKIDVATARLEVYDSPAALPTVEKSSIKADLYRRDFTINTLATQLNPKGFGELIDFFGGVKDIKEKAIRVLHNLSFVEDPTRVFRAIRFEQRLKFEIGKHTQNLMKNAMKMGFLDRLSGGRVFSELILILQEGDPVPALKRMRDFNLFHLLHPDLKLDEEKISLFERIHHVISWFDLLFLEERYERWLIYFYGFIDSLKEGERVEVCDRLAMNEKMKRRAVEGKRQADQALLQIFSWINASMEPKRSEVYTVLDPLSAEVKLFMMAKTTQVATQKYISLYFTQLKDTKPILRGADLVRLGIKPGPSIKKGLDDLLKARLDEQVSTRQDELEYLSRARGME
ncbi:MAG: CBS domain-containing protein [Thermodesulfobacteriota bacterium]|nr:CBS domain-containing protein [Thermodesulfobacteriota bacterium]